MGLKKTNLQLGGTTLYVGHLLRDTPWILQNWDDVPTWISFGNLFFPGGSMLDNYCISLLSSVMKWGNLWSKFEPIGPPPLSHVTLRQVFWATPGFYRSSRSSRSCGIPNLLLNCHPTSWTPGSSWCTQRQHHGRRELGLGGRGVRGGCRGVGVRRGGAGAGWPGEVDWCQVVENRQLREK
jgi:hypothetical protein